MSKLLKKVKILFIPCEDNKYKPRFLAGHVLFYYILALIVLKLVAVSFITCLPKTVLFADLTKNALVQLTNQERQSLGLSVLKENPTLNQAAKEKAEDMLASDYFSHYSPTGTSPWYWIKKVGYNYQTAGENLAVGFLDSEEVLNAWLNSPSHKANLINTKFQETGLAVVKGDFQGSETFIVVQLFGAPIKEVSKTVQATEITKPTETSKETKVTGPTKITETTKTTETTEKIIAPKKPEEPEEPKEPAITEETEGEVKEIAAGISEFQITQPSEPAEIKEAKEKASLNFFKFMALDYPNILQKVIFYSLFLITLALILNIFIKIHIQDKILILKTTAFLILLILFVWSDKELIISLIPHNLLI